MSTALKQTTYCGGQTRCYLDHDGGNAQNAAGATLPPEAFLSGLATVHLHFKGHFPAFSKQFLRIHRDSCHDHFSTFLESDSLSYFSRNKQSDVPVYS